MRADAGPGHPGSWPGRSGTLRELGEAGLLRRLFRRLGGQGSVLPPDAALAGGAVLVGPGDDAAVVEARGRLILTCDMLVEGVHFRRATMPPADLGHKALAVNVSDVAAMGGRPLWALVSLALPGELPVEFVDGLYTGLLEAAGRWGVAVVGGDTVGSPGGVVVDLTLVGEVLPGGPFLAGAARPGDVLLCTGAFGAAAAGLLALEGRLAAGPGEEALVEAAVLAHRRPVPRVEQAAALAALAREAGCAVAARDASDGLAAAARAIAEAAGCAVVLDAAAVPVSPAAALAERAGLAAALELALHGGEDYELVFAVPAALAEPARRAVAAAGLPVTPVGRVEEGEGAFLVREDGRREELPDRSFAHFAVGRAAATGGAGGGRGWAEGEEAGWLVETASPGETRRLGERLGRLLEPGDVVALTGPLGAGKTTFALGVLAGLGVEEDEGSPSFVLVNAYQGRAPVYHVDLYRLGERAAGEDLGWDELLGGPAVAVVEWAEYLGGLLPADRVDVRLERGAGEVRRIEMSGRGRRGRALVEALAALARA